MHHRHNVRLFSEHEWACISVRAPLGTVIIARKLPALAATPRTAGATTVWTTRRFALRILPDPAAKRPRPRRSL